jgi:hypothetical protein
MRLKPIAATATATPPAASDRHTASELQTPGGLGWGKSLASARKIGASGARSSA